MISANQLHRYFSQWIKECHEITKSDVVPIDGKMPSGTYDKDKLCSLTHIVSVNQIVLGQVKTAYKVMGSRQYQKC